MFNTMQELMAQVKGWEYGIAIVFLLLFATVWPVLARERVTRPQVQRARARDRGGNGARLGAGSVKPNWQSEQLPSEKREQCGEYTLNPTLPCWVARPLVEGGRSDSCPTCPMYNQDIERLIRTAKTGMGTSGLGQAVDGQSIRE